MQWASRLHGAMEGDVEVPVGNQADMGVLLRRSTK
jgi:hypothetical protein